MIHKEGSTTLIYSFVCISLLLAIAYYLFPSIFWVLFLVMLSLYLFLVSFFRNPKRELKNLEANVIYAPADGKIVVKERTIETEYLKNERQMISIFMSPLNVHVNRNPVSGVIKYYKYHPGKFLPAWEPKASTENERTSVVYAFGKHELMMRQIAGALAKRIVCYLKEGQKVTQGDDMGFIKLGSRVDLYLPLDAKIEVNIGDVVKGNITRIASIPT